MTAARLFRLSGLASMLAGVIYFVAILIRPAAEDAAAVMLPSWFPAHVLGAVAAILMLFAVVGIYARQADRTGWLGLIGFILALIASALFAAEESQGATILPMVADKLPALADPDLIPGPAQVFGITLLLSLVLGFVFLGIATARAGVLPRWGGWLFVIGLALTIAGGAVQVIGIIGAAVFGAAFVWLGYALFSGASTAGAAAA